MTDSLGGLFAVTVVFTVVTVVAYRTFPEIPSGALQQGEQFG